MNYLKPSSLAFGLMVVVASTASAQDYSGFYAGFNLGLSHSDVSGRQQLYSPLCAQGGGGGGGGCASQQSAIDNFSHGFNRTGFTGGGQVGYNWRSGILVIGVEADLNYANLSRSRTSYTPWTAGNGQKLVASTVSLDANDYVATVRPRIGLVATNNSLIYVTGGWAFADINFTNNSTVFNQGGGGPNIPIQATWNSTSSAKSVGYVLGGGFEIPVSKGVTFKTEFLHMRFDVPNAVAVNSTDLGGVYSLSNALLTSTYSGVQISTLRFGMNWKLFP